MLMPREIEVKSLLNKTKRRDPWFLDDYTINFYSSCSFNCLYCYIRGSKYGENLEESISVKVNGIELLEKQLHLRSKKQQYGFIVVSSATDPYLKIEEQYQLTRQALELIARYPYFYRKAFYGKMKELGKAYGIKDRILQ
jgi:DNA repair photolyase